MQDPRIEKLAANLVRYSCSLKKGEKVLIEAKGIDYMLVTALVKEAFEAGAYPFVEISDNRVTRALLMGETEEYAKLRAKYDGFRMAEMDAYIGVRGGENSLENSDVPERNLQIESEFYSHPVQFIRPCPWASGRRKHHRNLFFHNDIHHSFCMFVQQGDIHAERFVSRNPAFSNMLPQ